MSVVRRPIATWRLSSGSSASERRDGGTVGRGPKRVKFHRFQQALTRRTLPTFGTSIRGSWGLPGNSRTRLTLSHHHRHRVCRGRRLAAWPDAKGHSQHTIHTWTAV